MGIQNDSIFSLKTFLTQHRYCFKIVSKRNFTDCLSIFFPRWELVKIQSTEQDNIKKDILILA